MTFRASCLSPSVFFLVMILCASLPDTDARRHSSGRRKGKVTSGGLPFPNVPTYSSHRNNLPPNGAKIQKASHFAQTYKLGYKILLICEADGDPLPTIKWYKDGSELLPKLNTHQINRQKSSKRLKSRVEIDPATIGDQGVYTCLASNAISDMQKDFKAEYTF